MSKTRTQIKREWQKWHKNREEIKADIEKYRVRLKKKNLSRQEFNKIRSKIEKLIEKENKYINFYLNMEIVEVTEDEIYNALATLDGNKQ